MQTLSRSAPEPGGPPPGSRVAHDEAGHRAFGPARSAADLGSQPAAIGSGAVTAPFTAAEDTEVIIVIGANPAENHPVAATFFKQAVRQGAKLVETANDIVAELAPLAGHALQTAVVMRAYY